MTLAVISMQGAPRATGGTPLIAAVLPLAVPVEEDALKISLGAQW